MAMTKAAIPRTGLGVLAPTNAGIAMDPIRIAVFPFHTGEETEARDAAVETWHALHLSGCTGGGGAAAQECSALVASSRSRGAGFAVSPNPRDLVLFRTRPPNGVHGDNHEQGR